MALHRRPDGDPVLDYEPGSCSFTVEVIHGGFFVGLGNNRAYVDGTKVCYDEIDSDTWSALWLDDIIEDIGYESAGRIDVYWLLPGMQINEDGLRLISEDKDALSMIAKVKEGHRFLMLYLDHEPTRNGKHFDDVVTNPVARRDIADQEKFDAPMRKLQEDEKKRAEAAELKKAQASAKKLEKKRAEREAKQLAAEEKKIAMAEKKKKAQEEKQALADKKKPAQEARKREAEAAKKKKRLEMEAMKREAEEAKRKAEEETRTALNNAIADKLRREEAARQTDWENHLKKQEPAREQAIKDAHEKAETERILGWKERRRVAEESNKAQAAQFRASQHQYQHNKRKGVHGTQFTHRKPFKLPKKTGSFFDYLKGPPPGLDKLPGLHGTAKDSGKDNATCTDVDFPAGGV